MQVLSILLVCCICCGERYGVQLRSHQVGEICFTREQTAGKSEAAKCRCVPLYKVQTHTHAQRHTNLPSAFLHTQIEVRVTRRCVCSLSISQAVVILFFFFLLLHSCSFATILIIWYKWVSYSQLEATDWKESTQDCLLKCQHYIQMTHCAKCQRIAGLGECQCFSQRQFMKQRGLSQVYGPARD